MMRQKWGRIVNVTTSLGTMIREGSPTYGPSKAALEAFSAIMAKDLTGTGVPVNLLVPGGVTITGMVPLEAGYDRAEMIQPAMEALRSRSHQRADGSVARPCPRQSHQSTRRA
jgi:NAD(P)-dependent dehydrogenase (short-subunit alcohol dehydrogenase family)